MSSTATAPATEFDRGFATGHRDALSGFSLDDAYTGAFGAGYVAGWTEATS